jgi:hypothetical protein
MGAARFSSNRFFLWNLPYIHFAAIMSILVLAYSLSNIPSCSEATVPIMAQTCDDLSAGNIAYLILLRIYGITVGIISDAFK